MINFVGKTIEHYQILAKIRETPTRVLYKAYNIKSHSYNAFEVVKTFWLDPSELLELLNNQVRKNAELIHPNIANVTDIALHDNLIYIVYNFSPAHLLRRFFHRTYPWQELARELVSITHALGYAHENGVIHGYLHPSSIVIDEKKNPIIFDFGFERIITDYLLAHAPGAWINRWGFEYRAPELLSGAEPTWQSDIYAMGIMLHEWLIGKVPLAETTILGTLQLRSAPPKATKKAKKENAAIPPVVQELIQKCTAVNPADRYQSMQEIYIILARGALDMTITKKMVRKPLHIPAQRFKLGRVAQRRLGLVAILLIAGLFLFMNRTTISAMLPTPVPPTISPTPTRPTPTPTLVRPTRTPIPTQTLIADTSTPAPYSIPFPVYQATPILSAIDQTLNPDNIDKIVMLSIWGMGDINRLVSAPNGKYVAAASSIGIFIFDAASLSLEKHIDTRSWITAIEFSPDSQTLVSGDRDGLIQSWSTTTWEESRTPFSGHTKSILDLAFSPDGTSLASVALDNTLLAWKLNSADQKPLRTNVMGGVTSVAYSADNTRIITGGNDLLINIWDASNLLFLQKKDFSAKIVDITSLKDTNVFVIGGNDQKVALLDINGEATVKTVGNLQYPLTGVAASPNGELIAAGDINGGITVWDISGERARETWKGKIYTFETNANLDAPGSPHSLAFSPDGSMIFSGLHNGTLRSLDAISGTVQKINPFFNAHVQKMAVSHDNQYLLIQQSENMLTIWDILSGSPRPQQLQGEIMPGDPFTSDNSMVAVASLASGPANIHVYNSNNGDEVYTIKSQRDLKALQFTDDGGRLVAVYDQFTDVWSMVNGQEQEIKRDYDGTGCFAIKDINNRDIVSTTNYYYVVANSQNKPGLCVFDPIEWVYAVNDAQGLIVYGGNRTLAIDNAKTASRESLSLNGVSRKNIVSVAISPTGDLIAAAYDDHTIHIWDVATRDELTDLSGLYGHNNSITDLEFTPDGKLLISTSLDGTIRLWGVPY